jgi:NADH-quinone oxidoreductase subunit G
MDYRIAGMRMRREPHRYSGRTSMHAHVAIEEPRPAVDRDAPMTFTMEGYYGPDEPPSLLPFQWAPGWNSHQQALPAFQREIGGSLKEGDPGVRLFEGRRESNARYFSAIPRPFAARRNRWLIVPLYEVFGSDETSRHAAALAQRIPAPYLALAEADAQGLGLGQGDHARFSLDGETWILPVRIRPALPAGVAGIPLGLGDLPVVVESHWITIAPAGPDR